MNRWIDGEVNDHAIVLDWTKYSFLQRHYPNLTIFQPSIVTAFDQRFFAHFDFVLSWKEHENISSNGGVVDFDDGLEMRGREGRQPQQHSPRS